MDFCILIVLVRNCANVSDSYSSIYYQRCILHLRAYWRNVTSQQINEKTFKSLHWSPRLLRAFPLRKGIIELAIISNWNFSSIMFCTFFPLKKLEKKIVMIRTFVYRVINFLIVNWFLCKNYWVSKAGSNRSNV